MRSFSPERSIKGMGPGGAGGGGVRKFVTLMVAVVALITTVLASTTPAFARKHHHRSLAKPSAAASPTGQASITLKNGNVVLTNHNDFAWDLLKDGQLNGSTINWTVTDTKSGPVHTITVNGFVSVTNTGSADATIGNIVVNLQHRCAAKSTDWGSLSVDVADATSGDGGNPVPGPFGYDLIVAAASQEGTSKCKGSDYSTAGTGIGKFTENAGSGALSFTDADSNTLFSLVPEKSLAPGATVYLFYLANFNATALGLAPGAALRTETIVSFGNAGGRGGSGASLAKIDINGSGVVDCPVLVTQNYTSNECWVRSVPTRTSLPLPNLTTCNDSVTLSDLPTDDNPAASGTATFDADTFTTDIGGGSGSQSVSTSIPSGPPLNLPAFNVSVEGVDGGTDGGTISNCANLDSSDVFNQIQIGTDPITLQPIYQQFLVCKGQHVPACSHVDVPGTNGPPRPPFGNFCTWTQSQWTHKAKSELESGFPLSGVTVGGSKTMTFSTASDVENYLPAGGTNGKLTANLTNPTSSSSGTFGGDVLALQLNVDFNPAGFGALTLCGLNSDEADFDGMTVNQVLTAENAILGGAALNPAGNPGTYNGFDNLATHLNVSFEGSIVDGVATCHPTGFALNHLVNGSCP